MDMKYSTDS